MKGSRENVGFRISDFGFEDGGLRGSLNPNSEIRHPKSLSLSFLTIAHQMIWDLKCLKVIYIRVTKNTFTRFENPTIGSGLKLSSSFSFISGLFFGRVTNQGEMYA